MKVRDIQTYLEGYCPTTSLSLLGTDDEPFLETIYGKGQELDSTIRDVASFAKDSEEQLFYEFVQNAFDANADSLCFYFDKEYLIVLNNGDPFYTDLWERGVRPRDGQLYNFLAKGKSLKAGDEAKSGEFGQGSKLLYTLISDKGAASNKSQLIKSIKLEKKGPYLVSWGNVDQLNNFRLQTTEGWTRTDPYAENTDLLVCKILMTYYPVGPGVEKSLFSLKEFYSIRSAFERLVDPKRNINRLNKGTAIFIPLGEGQYEAISNEDNLKKVMTRLAGFAALTADLEKNRGRHLDHIYVNGEEVEMQHEVQSLFIHFEMPDVEERFSYQFAFNPVFAKESAVTLFKTLPITEARYRLGFIIDSPNFEHDSSRQRINDTKKTGLQLTEAFRYLLKEIKRIQATDKAQFDYIYDSLMASQTPRNDDMLFIRTPFFETFKPFIQENVRTIDGTYMPLADVRRPETKDIIIPLERLGIQSLHWLSEDLDKKKMMDRFELKVETLSLKDILLAADTKKLSAWVKSLSKEEYGLLHAEFLALSKEDETIAQKAVFLTNKGNVYGLNELITPQNPVLLYDDKFGHASFDRCLEIEYVLGAFPYASKDQLSNRGTVNVAKIASHIDFYRANDARIDVACRTLVDCLRFTRTKDAIRENVPLFKSMDGVYRPFKDLIREKPQGTILLDSFCAIGYGIEIMPADLLISKPGEIWDWLTEHLEAVTQLGDWSDQHKQYLKDIISLYEKAGRPAGRIKLNLNESGVPSSETTFLLRSDERLDNEQYELISMFAETKGYPLVPYAFKKTLSEAPFDSTSAGIGEIIGDGATVDAALLGCIVKVTGVGILRSFKVKDTPEGKYTITKNVFGHNYTCAIESDAIDAVLSEIGFSRISPEVCRYFDKSQLSEFELTTSNDLMMTVLDKAAPEDYPVLLPLVRDHNSAIVQSYLKGMPNLVVNTPVQEEDLTWQVIRFILGRISGDVSTQYRDELLRLVLHNGQRLPDSIKSGVIRFNDTDYDLYQLLGDVQVENELVDSFLKCVPDPDSFRTLVYSDNQETKSPEEVYDELYDSYLTVEQLRFCLDYSVVNECTYDSLEIAEDVALSDALEMIGKYEFEGFDEYFKMEGFNKDQQVYAPADLVLEEEKLPAAISDWIDKDPEKARRLIRGLNTVSDDYIAIRAALKDNEPFGRFAGVVDDFGRLNRTIQWIIEQEYKIPFKYSDPRFVTLKSLLDQLPENTIPLPVLRFTAGFQKDEDGLPCQILSFELLAENRQLMAYDNVYENARQIEGKPALRNLFRQNQIIGYTINYLTSQELNNETRYLIRTTAEKKDYPEWSSKVYNQWKETDESNGVRVFISGDPVSIMLSVTDEATGDHVLDLTSRNDLFGYDIEGKTVVIQHPNPEGISEMKTLERAAKAVDFFKNPFISLQSIYVDMVEQGIDPNALDENEKKAVELVQKLGEDTVNKLNDNLDTVKDIVEGLTEEELKTVAENKDKIQNLLEEIPLDDDDESMQSKVRKTIGYIGELIYKIHLEKQGIEYDYAAERGVGDYDFMLPSTDERPTLYVDVKTNLYSFKEEAVPFYIHKSQNRFMQEHPDEPFRIVRISLTDLDLKKTYEHIRDYFGAEADYQTNPELQERCEKIARDYWRSARIEEFDNASPEYGIKIERLPRE